MNEPSLLQKYPGTQGFIAIIQKPRGAEVESDLLSEDEYRKLRF